MNLGLLWRTGRHLTVEQGCQMGIRRIRHAFWRRAPEAARRRIEHRAQLLPLPDPAHPASLRLAGHVGLLQAAVHGPAAQMGQGRFCFLGREVDFGSLTAIDWRRDLGEESSPLWRLSLAYFGWALPLVAEQGAAALRPIAASLEHLERSCAWSSPGIFRDIWNPYTASHRLINLLCVAAMHRQSGGGASAAETTILEHVRFCAAYVAADLERDLQLNHLLKNYVALAAFLSAVDEVPATLRFLETAVPAALAQIVLEDGGHAERSPMYHALGLLDLRLLRECGVFARAWQPDLDRRIAAMERALAILSHPDGDVALFSDSWLGGAPRATNLDLPALAHGRHDLSVTGYVSLNAGEDRLIFDCGPLGVDFNPAHGHADYLSLEASLAGQRFLVDFGTPTYVSGPLRDASRSAGVHNGPRLSGSEPAELWKSFRAGRRGRAGRLHGRNLDGAPLWAAGWQDGYARQGVSVRRWVGMWPGAGFLVADLWQGAPAGMARSGFLVAQPWVPAGDEGFDGPIAVDSKAVAGSLTAPAPAGWWPRYGEEAPATSFSLLPDEGGFGAVGFFRRGAAPPDLRTIAERLRPALADAHPSTDGCD